MINKAGLTKIISIVLFLLITISFFFFLQNWYNNMNSENLANVKNEQMRNSKNSIIVETIKDNTLFIKNIVPNEKVNTIAVDNVECEINESLTIGLNKINITTCLETISSKSIHKISIITDKKVITKTLSFEKIPTPEPNSLCEKILAIYHFNNDSNFGENYTNVFDYSGNGNNLTCMNTSCHNYSSGIFNNAYHFDSNIYFQVSKKLFHIKQNYSIVFYARPDSNPTFSSILDSSRPYIYYTNNYFRFKASSTNFNALGIFPGNWYHMVFTQNGTHSKNYVNGAFYDEAGDETLINPANYVRIGAAGNNLLPFNGFIDELIIYNKTLTLEDVQSLNSSVSELSC